MLRPYKKEDIKKIVELEKNHLESSLEEEYYLKDLTNSLAKHYVFEIEGQVIGFISSIFDGFSLEILNFVIEAQFQSKGYGTILLATFLDEFVSLGLNNVSLEVRASNIKAIHLYEKFGFKAVRIREAYYKNKEDAYFMQKLYDSKRDIINLEAILFSSKQGLKFSSDFKERYCLNYYDLYDYRISSLKDFIYDDYLYIISNWVDEKLFQGFEISNFALLHVNAYHYQSLAKNNFKICLNFLDDYLEYSYKANFEYGADYAKKYASYSHEKILEGKIKLFSVLDGNKTVGFAKVLEYHHSIFISSLFVDEKYRNQGIAASIMDACIAYAKSSMKLEVYLEADLDDTPIDMYKRMNFNTVEIAYEIFKDKREV